MIEKTFAWQIAAILCGRVETTNESYCMLMGSNENKNRLLIRSFPKNDPEGVWNILHGIDEIRKRDGGEILSLFIDETEEEEKIAYAFHINYEKVGSLRQDKTEELCEILINCDEERFKDSVSDAVSVSLPYGYVVICDNE